MADDTLTVELDVSAGAAADSLREIADAPSTTADQLDDNNE